MTAPELARVVVVGSSCAGKTTFARRLAALLGHPAVELDELHWGPDWRPKRSEEFLRLAELATATAHWVVDGNYSPVRDVVWPRATAIVWLNLSLPTVFRRALVRTVRRSVTGEVLYAGNRETLLRAFLTRESILLWVLQTHERRRRQFAELRAQGTYPGLRWIEFRRAADPEAFLEALHQRRSHNARGPGGVD